MFSCAQRVGFSLDFQYFQIRIAHKLSLMPIIHTLRFSVVSTISGWNPHSPDHPASIHTILAMNTSGLDLSNTLIHNLRLSLIMTLCFDF